MHLRKQLSLGTAGPFRLALLLPALLIGATLDASEAYGQRASEQQAHAYHASTIWTGAGEAIQDAVLLTKSGKVIAVGSKGSIELPENTIVHDWIGKTIIPGLVVAQTQLVESTASPEQAITPEVRAIDGFDLFDDYAKLLAAGITTVEVSPSLVRLIPGQGGVVKLAGEEPLSRLLNASDSLHVVLTQAALSPPTVYEPPVGAVSVDRPIEQTQPQLATSLAQAEVGLKALLAEAEAYGPNDASDLVLETLQNLLEEKATFRFTAEQASEINVALQTTGDNGLSWILVDPVEIAALESVDWSKPNARGVIFNPELRAGRITNPNLPNPNTTPELDVWIRAKRLLDAGAGNKLALRPSTDADLTDLLFLAGLFQRGGLTTSQVLSMLTSNPAEMLGVSDRVGTLKPNADADFVVLNGVPFRSGTKIESTYVDGKAVFESTKNAKTIVIEANSIYTPEGLKPGNIVVANGKIAGVGSETSQPADASVMQFPGAVVVPGFIDCATPLGIGGSLSSQVGLDTKLGDFLARDDKQIALARQGGVTTALLSSTRLPSPVVAYKLGDSPRAVKDPVALRFELDGNLTAEEENMRKMLGGAKAYAASWVKYEADLAAYKKKLAEYELAKKKYDDAKKAAEEKAAKEKAAAAEKEKSKDADAKPTGEAKKDSSEAKQPADDKSTEKKSAESAKPEAKDDKDSESTDKGKEQADSPKEPEKPEAPKAPRKSSQLEPYRPLFAKTIVAMVEVEDNRAIEVAVKLFRDEFDLKTVIVADEAAAKNLDALQDKDVLVVVGPTFIGQADGKEINYAADLAVAGIDVAFQSQASTGMSTLPDAIAYAVYKGLGRSTALKGMTSTPADVFDLPSIGKLEMGADADLVVLSGPPFELSSEVLAVMIDGVWVYEKEDR